jgi:hypothetical protein
MATSLLSAVQLAAAANFVWPLNTIASSGDLAQTAVCSVAIVATGVFIGFRSVGPGLVVGSLQMLTFSTFCHVMAGKYRADEFREKKKYLELEDGWAKSGVLYLAFTILANKVRGSGSILPVMTIANPATSALYAAVTAVATTLLIRKAKKLQSGYPYISLLVPAVTAAVAGLVLPNSIMTGIGIGLGGLFFEQFLSHTLPGQNKL